VILDAKDDEGGDLPEDMQLDGDNDGDDGDNAEDDAMDVEDQPEQPDEPQDGADQLPTEGDDGERGDEPELETENKPMSGGAGELPEQSEEKPEEEEAGAEEDQAAPAESDASKPATFGVRNDQGKEALLNAQDDGAEQGEENKNAAKDQQQQPPSAASTEQPQGKGGVSQGESKKGATHEIGGTHREDDGNKPPPPRNQEPPNPFKQAGNVNEKWHRRLNLVLPPDEAQNDQDDGKGESGDNDDNENLPDGGGKGLYEHATKEEGAMEQVLADVAEEDAVQLPESGEQQDGKQRDLDSAMEQDHNAPEDAAKPEQDDRKRERDDERYRGQKAKKKRLNDDTAPEPVDGEVDDDPEDASESSVEMDRDGDDMDGDTSDEDDGAAEAETGAADNKDIFEGTKVFTKEQFKFGRTSEVAQAPEQSGPDEVTLSEADSLNISANRLAKGRLAWQQHRAATESYSMRLCEQLRLILEPTLATRLRGDYRTGKRINMRKVIPYVASGFRKDKIWLRRTKPAKRAYQVMIMIDDSMSMGAAGPLALSSLATIANALTRLEIGELSIASFADQVHVLHKFGTPFTEEAGARVVSQFRFQASSTLLSASLSAVLPVFTDARSATQSSASGSGAAVLQICFVISDARIDSDNREKLENTVRTLSEQHILVVLVIIDCNADPKDSIFNTKSVSFVGNKVVTKSYFDDFPFPYYVALQKVEALPDVLSDALKQWFELVRLQSGNA
jgi:midasin